MMDTKEPRRGPYTGYYIRPGQPKQDPLTGTGPGTPGGEYLRRFWHPFMMSSELKDGLPTAVRLLGEDLVIFRDGSGRLGLLHRFCAHRGVSLEFGIVGERGITCCYHGWQYDIDGHILDMPAEPPNSPLKNEFCQGAYPVREEHGLIFAYLGPPEVKPDFPTYDCYGYPDGNMLRPLKMELPCNWLQVHENACDPAHTTYLHALVSNAQFERTFRALPALDFIPTPLGFVAPATRRTDTMVFIRANDLIMPNVLHVTGSRGLGLQESYMLSALLTRWAVPADDHNTYYIGYVHDNPVNNFEGAPEGSASVGPIATRIGLNRMNLIGQTDFRPYEERQREPGDYDAMVSPGPVANRAAEHLATSDAGVVRYRRMLAQEIARVERGEEPEYPKHRGPEPIRTYCYSGSFLIGNAQIEGMEGLHEFGRRATQAVIETADLAPNERALACEERSRELLAGRAAA
jgi:nitrite reductase/ring-hydroxylating ferredoxin subunit